MAGQGLQGCKVVSNKSKKESGKLNINYIFTQLHIYANLIKINFKQVLF